MTTKTLGDRSDGPDVDVAVIGAGVAGLTFAVELAALRPDLRITVLESADRPGGQVRTTVANGYTFEHGATCLVGSPAVTALLQSLGLADRIQQSTSADRGTFLWSRGRLHAVPHGPAEAARSAILSRRGRVRALAEPWCGRGPGSGPDSVARFVARRFGGEAAEISRAAVAGITGGEAWATDLQSLLPKLWKADQMAGGGSLLHQVQRKRRSARGQPQPAPARPITLSDGGLAVLTATMAARLQPSVQYGSRVSSVALADGRYQLAVGPGRTLTATTVVLAVPAAAAAGLLQRVDPASAADVAGLPAGGMRVVGLGFPLDAAPRGWPGFGFLAIPGHGLSIVGATTTSLALPGQAPPDRMLVRAFLGGVGMPGALDLSTEEAMALVMVDLRKAMALSGEPELIGDARWPDALPQYPIGAAATIATVTDRLARLVPGVHLLGNSFFGAGLEDTIRTATALARSAGATLPAPPSYATPLIIELERTTP